MGLSQFKASTGKMTIYASTMDSDLKVWPRFILTRVSDGLKRVYDTGSGAGLTAAAKSTAAATTVGGDDGGTVISPAPLPQPCVVAEINPIESRAKSTVSAAAAAGSCAPVTLSCSSPWFPCGAGGICFPPLTEAERWARHNPWPKELKRRRRSRW